MGETAREASEIQETDIVFDCPSCGKSLAIDYRGAGLTIPCTDCGKYVEVPIPEGMELADIDSTEEEQEARILNLRRSLAAAEGRLEDMEEDLQAVNDRRETLEADRAKMLKTIQEMRDAFRKAQDALNELSEALSVLGGHIAGDGR